MVYDCVKNIEDVLLFGIEFDVYVGVYGWVNYFISLKLYVVEDLWVMIGGLICC